MPVNTKLWNYPDYIGLDSNAIKHEAIEALCCVQILMGMGLKDGCKRFVLDGDVVKDVLFASCGGHNTWCCLRRC